MTEPPHEMTPSRHPTPAARRVLAFAAAPLACLLATVAAAQPQAGDGPAAADLELYSVRFDDPGVIDRLRGATTPAAGRALHRWLRGAEGRAAAAEQRAAVEHLLDQRRAELAAELAVERLDPVFTFRARRPGFAVVLDPGQADRLAAHPAVLSVRRDRRWPEIGENGPAWIGADAVWSGAATGVASEGEGVVVAVIDSGILFSHPSFGDAPADGHTYTNPLGSGTFLGWCDPGHPDYSPLYACNDKLIGAWDYMDAFCAASPSCTEADGPADQDGHGTHVASIAVGNHVAPSGTIVEISGVAPHASLVVYDACTRQESAPFQSFCSGAAVEAAIDQAILDGVDVINLSILGGFDPWNDDDRALLDAIDAGIFVAAGAGNDGPDPSSVAHLGPWVAAVGATTHDRDSYRATLTLTGGPSMIGPFDGGSLNDDALGPVSVVYAGDYGSMDAAARVCGSSRPTVQPNPFPPGTFSGEIVACESFEGTNSSPTSFKSKNLLEAGAGGMIQLGGGSSSLGFATRIPSIGLETAASNTVRTWLASGAGHSGEISAALRTDSAVNAERLRSFSSIGPNPDFDVLKPDLVAPGSAVRLAPTFQAIGVLGAETISAFQPDFGGVPLRFASGTSMSSPHVAGAAALLRALHPAWTPDQVRSALATTAVRDGLTLEDGTSPIGALERGAGRIDVVAAARAALVLDEDTADYLAADPTSGGDPRTLNLPSLMHGACAGTCSFERTFTNVDDATETWSIALTGAPDLHLRAAPSVLTLAPGGSATVSLTVDVEPAQTLDAWQGADLELTPGDPTTPTSRLTVLLRPTAVSTQLVFVDGFESGDTSSWSSTTP
ncbi:MAG: hypothetical protein DWQ36_17365 [Acidobacteria bacterium]|nr:MAG: hypothetical protein DWQ30_05460 [Acidobacteriota bacterium]REK04615.1 MAG: hypothetical protein DWQ36_17365 [Acidobacteriota bacterium]